MSRCEPLRVDAPNWRPTGIWGAMKALASPAPAKTHSSEGTFMLWDEVRFHCPVKVRKIEGTQHDVFRFMYGPLCCSYTAHRFFPLGKASRVPSSNMGHRRFALLGLAVVVLFAVDGAAAASKGAPRAGGHRRASKTAGSRPSRSQRDAQDDREYQDWDGDTRKGPKRTTSIKPSRATRSVGSESSRVRPSSTGSARSSSRSVFTTRGNAKRQHLEGCCYLQPTAVFIMH